MLGNTASSTPDLLTLILGLLKSLTGFLSLGEHTLADQTVLGLELDHGLLIVVDEAKSGGTSSSKLGAESKEDAKLGVGLVHASNNFLELRLRDSGTSRMDDVNNHLGFNEE